MSLSFGEPRRRRRPDLTPMIDVVFLLLVFFMLASRFASETSLPLEAARGGAGGWTGPMRLVEIGPAGALSLNGAAIAPEALAAALAPLTAAPSDPVILRGRDAALQDLVSVMDRLRDAGFTALVLVE